MNNEINNEQILRDFLVYSYFGIVPERIYEKGSFKKMSADGYNTYCTKRAIMVAYRDATNQGAYNALFKDYLADRKEELIEESNAARKKAAEFLLDEIHALNDVSDFEGWHDMVCSGIEERYGEVKHNGKSFFTYGNAQKWVNMTMKYLWLLGLPDNTVACNKLHIPIDSFIIDAMWSDQNVNLPLRPENGDRSKTYAKPSDHVLGWSQWDDIMYGAFRSSLPEKYSLCWENDAWIEQAEKRKEMDLEDQYKKFFIK